jgi:hypothetical protein
MTEFNLVPEFAGVDTSRLTRSFDPIEQMRIIESLFGATSQDGPLGLPSSELIYIGRRAGGSEGYLIGATEGDKKPALLIPGNRGGKLRPLVDHLGDRGDKVFRGFLPLASSRILELARHTMQETLENRDIEYDRLPRDQVVARHRLNRVIIETALLRSPDHKLSEPETDELECDMAIYLGSDLSQAELLAEGGDCFNWEGRPFAALIDDLTERISVLRQPV